MNEIEEWRRAFERAYSQLIATADYSYLPHGWRPGQIRECDTEPSWYVDGVSWESDGTLRVHIIGGSWIEIALPVHVMPRWLPCEDLTPEEQRLWWFGFGRMTHSDILSPATIVGDPLSKLAYVA